ncbi:MAG: hypothetical protein R3E91_04695 [Chlamydiales bacterium]
MRLEKWILILIIVLGSTYANEMVVNTRDGKTFLFEFDPSESLAEIQARITSLTKEAYFFMLSSESEFWKMKTEEHGNYLGSPRDYSSAVTLEEWSDIHYIVNSLANQSLIAIAFMKTDLEAAGNRIDHIHPLRFLMTVFTDEELKVGIRNIFGRGWIWHHFINGVKDCLDTEANIGNLKDEYVYHFASIVAIHPHKILEPIHEQNWDQLIKILLEEIPRQGNCDRYGECRY